MAIALLLAQTCLAMAKIYLGDARAKLIAKAAKRAVIDKAVIVKDLPQ